MLSVGGVNGQTAVAEGRIRGPTPGCAGSWEGKGFCEVPTRAQGSGERPPCLWSARAGGTALRAAAVAEFLRAAQLCSGDRSFFRADVAGA